MSKWQLMLMLILSLSGAATADIVVIADVRNALPALTNRQVMELYLGRQPNLPGGVSVLPLDLINGQSARQAFYAALCGKSEAQIDAYWARLEFAGHMSPPSQLPTVDAVLDAVQRNPLTIGFVPAQTLPANVKILLTLATPP